MLPALHVGETVHTSDAVTRFGLKPKKFPKSISGCVSKKEGILPDLYNPPASLLEACSS